MEPESEPVLTDPAALAEEVSLRLVSDGDSDQALVHMLQLLVPALADWGTVHVVTDGSVRKLSTIHSDPEKAHLAAELHSLAPNQVPVTDDLEALRERVTGHLLDPIDDEVIDLLTSSPRVRELWKAMGMTSMVAVPLHAHGQVFGRLALVMSDSSRRFGPGDLALIEEMAGRSAMLVDTARLVRASTERLGGLAMLDTLLAEAPLAMAVVDADQRVMYANRAFFLLAPGSPSSATGRSLRSLVPALADDLCRGVEEVLGSGTAVERVEVLERGLRLEEARRFVAGVYPVSRSDGSLLGVGCYLSEITQERRTAAALEENHARLDLSLAAGGLGSWDWDVSNGRVVCSEALELLAGLAPGTFGQTTDAFLDFVYPEDRAEVGEALLHAARSGEEAHIYCRVIRPDGVMRWIELRGRMSPEASLGPTRMVGVAADVTEERRMDEIRVAMLEREHSARLESDRVGARLAFLDEAGTALSSTLDPIEAFAIVARLIVPRIADACLVDAVDGDGHLHEIQIESSGSIDTEDLRVLRRHRLLAGGDGLWSVRRTIRTGKAELLANLSDEDHLKVTSDEDHLSLLLRISPRSAITVPLIARGRALGGVTIITTGERRLRRDDLVLMQNLADRAAMAVDNARLFASSTRVARTLQEALLPPALPTIAGIEVEARYRVAEGVHETGTEIGGDFYDLFEVGAGAWAVVMGDVCGKGTEAAALTGLIRHTLRAAAVRERRPSRVLMTTNDAILDQIDDSRFCTVLLARMVASPAGALITMASGGHPSPIVVRADGRVEEVMAHGTLLGVVPDPVIRDVDVALGPGDSLVMFTDGVTEARHGSEQFGERALMRALADVTTSTAAEISDHVLEALDQFRDGRASDDTALLVLRVSPAEPAL